MSKKITDLTALSPLDSDSDLAVVVDVDDATMAPTGTDKKVTLGDLRTQLVNSTQSVAANAKFSSVGVNTAAPGAGAMALSDGSTTWQFGVGSTRLILFNSGNVFAFINSGRYSFQPYGDGGADLGDSATRWGNVFTQRVEQKIQTLASGATPAVDASAGSDCFLSILTNIAVTIAVPTNPPTAGHKQRLTIEIKNGSGGALTTPPAFNAGAGGFKVSSSLPALANGQRYTIAFTYSQDAGFWIQDSLAPFAY